MSLSSLSWTAVVAVLLVIGAHVVGVVAVMNADPLLLGLGGILGLGALVSAILSTKET